MRILANLRRLRGTPFDPFGWTAERRCERALIFEFETLANDALTGLCAENYNFWCDHLASYQKIRGFGHVKIRSIERWRKEAEKRQEAVGETVGLKMVG